MPKGPSVFIAQEFLDALPVHQFQYTAKGWREVLVDVNTPDTGGVPEGGVGLTVESDESVLKTREGDPDGSGPRGEEPKMEESSDMFR